MIVREGKFVGVVAKTEWAAIKAAQALKVTWSPPTFKLPANQEETYAYLQKTKPMRSTKAVERGNVDDALKQAKKSYARTYRFPFQLHGMIGPSCAIADVKSDRATIWCGTQGPFRSRKNIATLLGLPEKDVRVIYYEGAGSYGRLATEDAGEDAALLSRAVGAPVRVQWSRQDEHGWSPKGPAQVELVRAARRRRRQADGVGFHRPELAAHRSRRHAHAGFCASRHQAGEPRRHQRQSERRRNLRRRQSAHRRQLNQLAFRRAPSAAHEPTARSRRHLALFRHRVHARRDRR